MRPVVLTIAGSDPSGGAGIQADLKTIEACGGYAATVITAITVQNSRGVLRVEVLDADLVSEQLAAVLDDLPVAAIKTGMLGSSEIVRVVARALESRPAVPVVCDPILAATSGAPLLAAEAVRVLVEELLPRVTLLTPNAPEAELLGGMELREIADVAPLGRRLLDLGPRAVLVKGGHLEGDACVDHLVTADGCSVLEAPRVSSRHTHGTGCVLSSAIATQLARGRRLPDAVSDAKRFVTAAIRHALPLGSGRGPIDPLFSRHVASVGADAPPGAPGSSDG